jgi:hypothetical protein
VNKFILLLACCTALVGCASAIVPATEIASAPRRALTDKEKIIITRAVTASLKDPDSAKFQWVPIVEDARSAAYCGLVNAKNSYGGYVGYYPFLVRVEPNTTAPITSASAQSISHGPDEIGIDIVAGACANWGYTDFSAAL